MRLLHGVGGRRSPRGLRDARSPGGRPGHHHPGRAARGPRDRWAAALLATGGSQCGFCTPGIVMRLAAPTVAARAGHAAHPIGCIRAWLPTCAAARAGRPSSRRPAPSRPPRRTGRNRGSGRGRTGAARDLAAAAARASLEGGVPQRVGPDVVLGDGGFADDTCPPDALVAVPDGRGGYAVGATLAEARQRAGKVQGRNVPGPLGHPVAVPGGRFDLTLQTTWVEPGYLETDASWCSPGGIPASACANGGAFGGKLRSPVPDEARRLADELGRPVRVLWSREDVVRFGPKRPPVAAGVDADGAGVLRVGMTRRVGGRTPPGAEVLAGVAAVAPGLSVETVEVHGPPGLPRPPGRRVGGGGRPLGRSPVPEPPGGAEPRPASLSRWWRRAVAGQRCAAHRTARSRWRSTPGAPSTRWCSAPTASVPSTRRWAGSSPKASPPTSRGEVRDLTVRSFGILPARAMPEVRVTAVPSDAPPVNGSDAVFAATAAACWIGRGLPPAWPIDRSGRPREAGSLTLAGTRCATRRPLGRARCPSLGSPTVPAALGPYSPIVAAGPWLVCSGQLGVVPDASGTPQLVDGGVAAQLAQALANAAALLAGQGATLTDVVKTTVFVTDLREAAAINQAYTEFFGDHRPARSMVAVAGLPLGALAEVEVWAYRQPADR